MSADLQLDPDGVRRVARSARRIADRLDGVDPGPPVAGPDIGHLQDRLSEAVRRSREELLALATEATSVADRADEADRVAGMSLRSLLRNGPPGRDPTIGRE